MSFSGLHFVSGQVISACTIHIDTTFPDLAAVQFLHAGSLYFEREGHCRQEWKQPAFFWTDLTSRYQYGPGETGSWDHRWVSFGGPSLRRHILPLLEEMAPEGIVPVSNAPEVEQRICALAKRVLDTPENLTACTHLLHQLLAAVHDGRPGRPPPDPVVRSVREEVDRQPGKHWDFADAARSHGTSYSRFRARFREQVGTSPGQYLINRRMREAARLLASSHLSIQEIGDRTGYADPSHFSKAFKKQFRVSPRQYRSAISPFQQPDSFSPSTSGPA